MDRYEWDAGNTAHITLPGVTPAECEEAFDDQRRVPSDAYDVGGEIRGAIIGATSTGRVLRVVFTMRGAAIRVVTAHDAKGRQAGHYPAVVLAEEIEDDD